MIPFFHNLLPAQPDPIFEQAALFQNDQRPYKLNLGIGIVPGESGGAYCFRSVKRAEPLILEERLGKGYLPIDGITTLNESVLQLILGEKLFKQEQGRCYAGQTLGGTGALFIAMKFLAAQGIHTFYIPQPTWPNHIHILKMLPSSYSYYPYAVNKQEIMFETLYASIEKIPHPESCAILLQGCCHNPTGLDLSLDQWHALSVLIQKKGLFPLFDIAYQGLGDGLESDVEPIRLFTKEGHSFLIAYSFAKNLGIYGERLGMLIGCFDNNMIQKAAKSHIKGLIRATYSNPALHGQKIGSYVLGNPDLKQDWERELSTLREKIYKIRYMLHHALSNRIPQISFAHVLEGKGMFTILPMDSQIIEQLQKEKGIYVLEGRINLAALHQSCIEEFVEAYALYLLKK